MSASDLDPATARAAMAEMQRSHGLLKEENKALRRYVDFLGQAYNDAYGIALNHGHHATEAKIEEGRRLRVLAGLPEWPGNG